MVRTAHTRLGRAGVRVAVLFSMLVAGAIGVLPARAAGPQPCANLETALGVGRMVQIDTSVGRLFGSMTSLPHERTFLRPKEVVLTFDDGPMPWVTKSVLDTLDRFCTKATFFSVGRMAVTYPNMVRDLVARGHTLASHTYSHPYQLPHMPAAAAKEEIDRGVAAVSAAAGINAAPFFRFPGLAASRGLVDYAGSQGLATFTVDVVSNDSYISDPKELAAYTLKEIEARGRGIVLFHDIKSATAKALPLILAELSARGYSIVHLTAKTPAAPSPELLAEYSAKLGKAPEVAASTAEPMPFYGREGPSKPARMTVATQALPAADTVTKTVLPKAPAGAVTVAKSSKRGPSAPETPSGAAATAQPVQIKLSQRPKDAHTAASSARTHGYVSDPSNQPPGATPAAALSGPPVIVNADEQVPLSEGGQAAGSWTAKITAEPARLRPSQQ